MDLVFGLIMVGWVLANAFVVVFWLRKYRSGVVTMWLRKVVSLFLYVNLCIVALMIFVIVFLPVEVYGRVFYNVGLLDHYRTVF